MAAVGSAYQNTDRAIATGCYREQLITDGHVDTNDSLVSFGTHHGLLNTADSGSVNSTTVEDYELVRKKAVYLLLTRLSDYRSDVQLIALMASQT